MSAITPYQSEDTRPTIPPHTKKAEEGKNSERQKERAAYGNNGGEGG